VPQILNHLGCLLYSPPLERQINQKAAIATGSTYEIQLRGCTIWCVELIRREILRLQQIEKQAQPHTEDAHRSELKVNAILIDFFLYDSVKEQLEKGEVMAPHHRTRSVWY
jgi:hypothetical protein